MSEAAIIKTTLELIEAAFSQTAYDDKRDAEVTWTQLRSSLPSVCASSEGKKHVQKFSMLGTTATTGENFNDMVKIIWRVVKSVSEPPMFRFALFFLSIGAMIEVLSRGAHVESVDQWRERLAKWLGKQLTIGGKGVVGEGEGKVVERVRQFFSTPYLHEFD